jgi:hypothetical protein
MLGRAAMIAFGAFALASCQTLNEDECSVTDWRILGSGDGAAGRPQTYVANHQKACSKYGIPVDVALWQSGWNEGIRQYCTPQNGLQIGERGTGSVNSCPADLSYSFREGYDVGRQVYSARSERDRIQRELNEAIEAVAVATPDQRVSAQLAVDLKRNELFSAQNRLNDTQRAADFFRLRLSRPG